MIAGPGCTDRQRRLAANEDAAAAVFDGLADGDIESAIRWQHWLAAHRVSRQRALALIGLEPAEFSQNPAWLGRPVAISQYGGLTSTERVVWMPLENDDVLGVSTSGLSWLVPADDAIPHVTLAWPEARPTTPRSPCCFAPVQVRLPLDPRRIDELLEGGLGDVPLVPERICGLCWSVLNAT